MACAHMQSCTQRRNISISVGSLRFMSATTLAVNLPMEYSTLPILLFPFLCPAQRPGTRWMNHGQVNYHNTLLRLCGKVYSEPSLQVCFLSFMTSLAVRQGINTQRKVIAVSPRHNPIRREVYTFSSSFRPFKSHVNPYDCYLLHYLGRSHAGN